MVIFPWEVDFYKKEGVKVVYFGNPFVDKYSVVERTGDKFYYYLEVENKR